MRIGETRGITLIGLVVAIIVLVLLAGVVMASLGGNDSIIENASVAVEQYKEKASEEQGILNSLEEKLKEFAEIDNSKKEIPIGGSLATEPVVIKPDKDSDLQIVIPAGFGPAVLETGTTKSLPGENGGVKGIMANSEWKNITVEDINKGIVLVDHDITYDGGKSSGAVPDFNEFVWIPITNSNSFARIAWKTAYGYDIDGEWQVGTLDTMQQLAEKSTANCWWEVASTSEYTELVNSVIKYKGFYVARYEASKNNDLTKAQSKRHQEVWSLISQTDAIEKSANYNSKLHSHLMYGIEWDSILNWLNGNAIISSSENGETKTMDISDLQTTSRSWGNYSNSIGDAKTNCAIKQKSGTSEYWKANNIYDLAGNVFEWTQENWSTGKTSAERGGNCNCKGDVFVAVHRYSMTISSKDSNIGFRTCFYL